jgi:hypothetical protein
LCFGKFTFEEYLNFFFSFPHFIVMLFIIISVLVSDFFFPWMLINNTYCWIYFIRCHFLTYLMLYTRHQLTG